MEKGVLLLTIVIVITAAIFITPVNEITGRIVESLQTGDRSITNYQTNDYVLDIYNPPNNEYSVYSLDMFPADTMIKYVVNFGKKELRSARLHINELELELNSYSFEGTNRELFNTGVTFNSKKFTNGINTLKLIVQLNNGETLIEHIEVKFDKTKPVFEGIFNLKDNTKQIAISDNNLKINLNAYEYVKNVPHKIEVVPVSEGLFNINFDGLIKENVIYEISDFAGNTEWYSYNGKIAGRREVLNNVIELEKDNGIVKIKYMKKEEFPDEIYHNLNKLKKGEIPTKSIFIDKNHIPRTNIQSNTIDSASGGTEEFGATCDYNINLIVPYFYDENIPGNLYVSKQLTMVNIEEAVSRFDESISKFNAIANAEGYAPIKGTVTRITHLNLDVNFFESFNFYLNGEIIYAKDVIEPLYTKYTLDEENTPHYNLSDIPLGVTILDHGIAGILIDSAIRGTYIHEPQIIDEFKKSERVILIDEFCLHSSPCNNVLGYTFYTLGEIYLRNLEPYIGEYTSYSFINHKYKVLQHEMGHSQGLDHGGDPKNIMYPSIFSSGNNFNENLEGEQLFRFVGNLCGKPASTGGAAISLYDQFGKFGKNPYARFTVSHGAPPKPTDPRPCGNGLTSSGELCENGFKMISNDIEQGDFLCADPTTRPFVLYPDPTKTCIECNCVPSGEGGPPGDYGGGDDTPGPTTGHEDDSVCADHKPKKRVTQDLDTLLFTTKWACPDKECPDRIVTSYSDNIQNEYKIKQECKPYHNGDPTDPNKYNACKCKDVGPTTPGGP